MEKAVRIPWRLYHINALQWVMRSNKENREKWVGARILRARRAEEKRSAPRDARPYHPGKRCFLGTAGAKYSGPYPGEKRSSYLNGIGLDRLLALRYGPSKSIF